MSKVAGPGLQSPIRRISASCLSDKENSPLGVTRLRTLLKRKVKKAQSSTESKIKNKIRVPKTDVWVNLKDGTKIKLCSTCATKKKNTASETPKTKDQIKLSNKVKDNSKDNNDNKPTLKTTKIAKIPSHKKLLSHNNEKSIVKRKETTPKVIKPKVTRITKKDNPKTETLISNEAKQRGNKVADENSTKQVKVKRTPKSISSTQNDTHTEKKKRATTRVTNKEKNVTLNSTNKSQKASKLVKADSKIPKTPKPKKTDKNRSKINTDPEQDPNNINLAKSDNEKKSRKKKKANDDDADKSEITKNKKPREIESKIINKKSTKTLSNSKAKDSKTSKLRNLPKNNKTNKEEQNQSDSFNSEIEENNDDSREKQSVKRRVSVVAKKIKTKDPVKKPAQIKERKVPARSASKTLKIKSNLTDSKNIKNSSNNSMDDLLADINIHSTLIEDNIVDDIQANESKRLKNNKKLARRASVGIKLEPIDDENETNPAPMLKNLSLQNNSSKKILKSRKNAVKPEKLMHITFRDKSMEQKPASAKQLKINKCEKDTEARKKFKNDKKVAKALGQMSKHFSKLQIGKMGKLRSRSRFSDVNLTLSSTEDSSSSLHSRDCSCTSSESSTSSSSHCQCWKCEMEKSLYSSSWTESSKYSGDTVSCSCGSDSSALEGTRNKTRSNTYELRNRKL